MNEQESAPVKEGEIYDVYISAIGGKGDGIAKVKGFVLFVPSAKKGDYLKVRVTKVIQNVGFVEVVEKLKKPVKESKFATVTKEEMAKVEEQKQYEDTEDFGEE